MESVMKRLKSFILLGVMLIMGGIIWGMARFNQNESSVVKQGEYFRSAGRICEKAGIRGVLPLVEDYVELNKKLFPYVKKVTLYLTRDYLRYTTGEEALSYFQVRYPEMCGMDAYLLSGYTLWDDEEEMFDQIFYVVEEPDVAHGFFVRKGNYYEVVSQGETEDNYDMVNTVRRKLDYEYTPLFSWHQEADGNMMMLDNLESNFFYIRDLGGGEKIQLRAKIIGRGEPGESTPYIYQVEIYDEKGEELIQEFQVTSTYGHESPFVFEDYNADGYLDLTIRYFYGVNGGSASHYIFSPSKREFMELDSELDYYSEYSVDYEKRRLYKHSHGSAISGTEFTCQWEGEMDCELIKVFDHNGSPDIGVQVWIACYDQEQEEVICDYRYTYEEYDERVDDIWRIYKEDFIWEKEIRDKDTGKKYMLRYMEVFDEEEAASNKGIYYEGWIYVFDEDTYLVGVHPADHCTHASSFTWKDAEQELLIRYGDSGSWTIPMSGLIRRDYQPAEE